MVGHNNGGANSAAVRTETVKMCEAVWTEAKVTLRIQVVSTTLGRPEVTACGTRWKKHITQQTIKNYKPGIPLGC